jgi:hypothetical protein
MDKRVNNGGHLNCGRKVKIDKKKSITLRLTPQLIEWLTMFTNKNFTIEEVLKMSQKKSCRLLFCEMWISNEIPISKWSIFVQEIINSSAIDLIKDDCFIPGLLMEISKKKDNDSIKKWQLMGDIFFEYFFNVLQGEFAALQNEKQSIKYLLQSIQDLKDTQKSIDTNNQ